MKIRFLPPPMIICVLLLTLYFVNNVNSQNYISTSSQPTLGNIYHLNGNLGLGLTNPLKNIHIKGVTNSTIRLAYDIPPFPSNKHTSWDIRADSGSLHFDYSLNAIYQPNKVLISESGTLTATKFIGDGSGLTNLPDDNYWTKNSSDIYYNAGNVGIGTISPLANVHIKNQITGQNPKIRLENPFMTKFNDEIYDSLKILPQNYFWDIEAKGDGIVFSVGNTMIPIPIQYFTFSNGGTLTATKFVGDGSSLTGLPWTKSGTNVYYNTGNVGIGKTNPATKLDVNGTVTATNFSGNGSGLTNLPNNSYWSKTGTNVYYIEGNVGIGTNTPESSLHIKKEQTETDYGKITLETIQSSFTSKWNIISFINNGDPFLAFSTTNDPYDYNILFNSTGNIDSKGSADFDGNGTFGNGLNVTGISTFNGNINAYGNITTSSDISAKNLHLTELTNTFKFDASNVIPATGTGSGAEIGSSTGLITFYYEGSANTDGYNRIACGDIWSKGEIIIDNYYPWGDYVFETDYDLMSLHDLENFITTQKHLPEMPTTCDVEENGQNIGEINVLLVKKIEELTLYIIDLQKQIDELKTTEEE